MIDSLVLKILMSTLTLLNIAFTVYGRISVFKSDSVRGLFANLAFSHFSFCLASKL